MKPEKQTKIPIPAVTKNIPAMDLKHSDVSVNHSYLVCADVVYQ